MTATRWTRGERNGLDVVEVATPASTCVIALHGAQVLSFVPRGDRDYAFHVGLRMLSLRHLVEDRDGLFSAVATERLLLAYYANAIAHLR